MSRAGDGVSRVPAGGPRGRIAFGYRAGHRARRGHAKRVRMACIRGPRRGRSHGMITILLVILILMLIGALPTWPHSSKWGYGPSGGLGTVLVILLVLYLLHVI